MEKLQAAFREYFDELLYKVQWPTLEELQESTVVVLVASLLLAVAIALVDGTFQFGIGGLYAIFK